MPCACPPASASSTVATYQEQQKSFADLFRVLLLALALVFGVLLTEFRNFAAPFSILISSVLSIGGVVFALLITGTSFNVASFMGLIMVIGIVAKNGILLLDADERYRAEGQGAREAMMMAAQRRLRPILMTALAAVTGNASAGVGPGRRFADAAAACNCSDRRRGHLHAAQPGGHAGHLLPADAPPCSRAADCLGKSNGPQQCGPLRREYRLYLRPTTITVKVSGTTEGRGRGFAVVASGRVPYCAVTRYTRSVPES